MLYQLPRLKNIADAIDLSKWIDDYVHAYGGKATGMFSGGKQAGFDLFAENFAIEEDCGGESSILSGSGGIFAPARQVRMASISGVACYGRE